MQFRMSPKQSSAVNWYVLLILDFTILTCSGGDNGWWAHGGTQEENIQPAVCKLGQAAASGSVGTENDAVKLLPEVLLCAV